jgi:hypothetical protein
MAAITVDVGEAAVVDDHLLGEIWLATQPTGGILTHVDRDAGGRSAGETDCPGDGSGGGGINLGELGG